MIESSDDLRLRAKDVDREVIDAPAAGKRTIVDTRNRIEPELDGGTGGAEIGMLWIKETAWSWESKIRSR